MKAKRTSCSRGYAGLSVLVVTVAAIGTGRAGGATWTQKADMPTPRWGASTCVVDGKIYAIGGTVAHRGAGLATVEEYDPATDTWTEKAEMPTPRDVLSTSVVNGKIYAIGGSTVYGGTLPAAVEEYDPARDTWTEKAEMPTPRAGLVSSVVNGKIYAIGGGPSGVTLATVEEYDPATDTWTKKADMPTARKLLSTSVVDGQIYAVGGQTSTAWPAFRAVEKYDPVTDTWTKMADMPTSRNWMSTSVVGGRIYAFGGNSSRGGPPTSMLTQYDPATDIWTSLDAMPVRLGGLSASAVAGRIYVIGGTSTSYPYGPPLSTVWEYDTGIHLPSPDFNGDGMVDAADMAILVDHWHTDSALYDIAPAPWGDGMVDVQDLVALAGYLGQELDDPTLIAHWAMDEVEGSTAFDGAGGNHGILLGGPVWSPGEGMVDGALEFDGVDDWVVVVGRFFDPAMGPFSVFAWVQGGGPGQVILSQYDGKDWLSMDATGVLMTDLKGASRALPLYSPEIIVDGGWHRIGLTWDGVTRSLYLDNVLVAEDEPGDMPDVSEGLNIGCGAQLEPGTFFSGLIDDVRIYNRAVSP